MHEAVLLGIAAAYENPVRERLETPWRLTVLPPSAGPAALAAALDRAEGPPRPGGWCRVGCDRTRGRAARSLAL